MKNILCVLILMISISSTATYAYDETNWGIPTNSEVKHQKEVSEYIWDAEIQSYIESEYGSEESNYFNNCPDSYSNSTGGDAFDTYSY